MTELEAWLRLWHIPKVGPRTFNFVRSKFPCLENLFNHGYPELVEAGIPKHIAIAITTDKSEHYLNDLAWLQGNKYHHITSIKDSSYPALLAQIVDPPPIIYSIGHNTLLASPLCIAIVGSRSASTLGKKIAYDLAKELAQLGVVIVSGLARGIDGQAHEGAMSKYSQSTIGVLANGLDMIYPHQHRQLGKQLAKDHLLVSEFAPGVKPLPQHFPRRNRIISGLSLGTLVIEAANKSGSLITANYALQQGRDVFAVPGNINNPQNAGCHQLIQQGAKLTTCIEDILLEVTAMIEIKQNQPAHNCINNHQNLGEGKNTLLECVEYTPLSIEEIIEKSGLTPEQVSSMLTELEIGGYIAADAIGQYSRI